MILHPDADMYSAGGDSAGFGTWSLPMTQLVSPGCERRIRSTYWPEVGVPVVLIGLVWRALKWCGRCMLAGPAIHEHGITLPHGCMYDQASVHRVV